jgi:opacity protein-like surface antigen
VEVEGNYRSNAIDSIGAAFTGADGLSGDPDIGAEKKYGAMVNALYEIHGERIAPYFGAGIGGQFVHEPAVNSTSAGGVAVAVAATTTGTFAYQLVAGTAFPIHRQGGLSITAEYRLMSLVGARESTATVTIPGLGAIEVVDSSSHDRNHAVLFGIRYVFGG